MPPSAWHCVKQEVEEVTDATEEILDGGNGSSDPSPPPSPRDGWLCKKVGGSQLKNWELVAAASALLLLLLLAAGCRAWVRRRRRRGQHAALCCCAGDDGRAESASMKEKLIDGHYRGAIKTGYLQKQGHARKNWKQRFFVLEQSVMLYYERPTDLQPKGTVRMDHITLALATEITGKPHCFGIFHPTREPYYLVARNEAEMMKWVRAIRGDGKVGLVDFDVVSKLGQGNFGKVVLVKKKSANPRPGVQPKYYAMKILSKDAIIARKDVAHANAERRILQQINHPFIVRLHYAFQTGEKLYMVMDFVSGGDLYFHLRRLRRFNPDLVKIWMCELVLAIEYLHSMNVVYRDLKPENVLVDTNGHLHLADFGLSKQSETDDEPLKTFCGTPYYVAPEMLVGTKKRKYTKGVDWWSLGILCHELLVGQPPFYSTNVDRVYEKIARDAVKFPPTMRQEPRRLIEALLQRHPSARLGATSGGAGVKTHTFFDGVDWQAVFDLRVETGFCPQNTAPGEPMGLPLPPDAAPATGQFDPFFTRQRAADSFEQPVFRESNDPKVAEFEGFSFRGTPMSMSYSQSSSTSSGGTSGGSGESGGGGGRGRGNGAMGSSMVMSDVASDRSAGSGSSRASLAPVGMYARGAGSGARGLGGSGPVGGSGAIQ